MTDKQRELARHALGLPNRTNRSYRNRFVCGRGHPNAQDWVDMTAAGEAVVKSSVPAFGSVDLFFLTTKGARLALMPGESLDSLDFPDAEANS